MHYSYSLLNVICLYKKLIFFFLNVALFIHNYAVFGVNILEFVVLWNSFIFCPFFSSSWEVGVGQFICELILFIPFQYMFKFIVPGYYVPFGS